MFAYLKNCFSPVEVPVKEYIVSSVSQIARSSHSTLTIEVTASADVIDTLHSVLTSTAYQLLADSVRTK
jgi:hypothetical protein